MNDKFLVNDILYSDLELMQRLHLIILFYHVNGCQLKELILQKQSHKCLLGSTQLQKSLSQGELIKAHGWKGNISEIELAKAIIGNCWTSSFNEASMFDGFEDKIIEIKNKMARLFW